MIDFRRLIPQLLSQWSKIIECHSGGSRDHVFWEDGKPFIVFISCVALIKNESSQFPALGI